jgi:hypothetical protein
MSRHDGKTNACASYTNQFRRALAALLPRQGLRLLPLNDKERWTPRYLVITAVLMACLGTERLIDRFHAARTCLIRMYLTRRRPGDSYQGFIGALKRLGDVLLQELARHLRLKVWSIAPERWLIDGWLVFGCDGSRFDKTRTQANQEAFGCAGRTKTGPQQFLTTLFHVGTGLPWSWRAGNADASERDQLRDMMDLLPPAALLLLDGGYCGYGLLRQITGSGRSFIMRVGSNVELLDGLGWHWKERHDGIVSLWPKHAWERREPPTPPLTLRLVSVLDAKGKWVHLLSNVLEKSKLTDAAVRRMYKLRWEIEILFRTIKHTMQLRKAHAWTPDASAQELEWGMMGVWLLGLMALQQQQADGTEPSPRRWSAAETLRIVRRAIHGSLGRGPSLAARLREAVRDGYRRRGCKSAVDYPRKKREKPPGDPRRRRASRQEVRAARQLKAA